MTVLYMRFVVWVSQLLIEDGTDAKVSAAVVLGLFWGVTPLLSLQWFVALVLACLVRLNLLALLLSSFVFWGLGQLLEPLFNAWGTHLLTQSGRLIPLWAWMYHAPIIPFTEFNYTVVMGGTVFAIVATIPVYLLTRYGLKRYRATVYHAWRTTKLYRNYVIYKEYAR